jgi:hypothetical protein
VRPWALNIACGNSHEDATQDHVEDSLTLFRANSNEPTREIQQTVMLDCCSSLVPQEPLTTAANKPQSIDGGDTCGNLNQNTNKHWITNHPPTQPLPQAASDTPQEIYNELMNIDDEHNAGGTMTAASSPAESGTNEFDSGRFLTRSYYLANSSGTSRQCLARNPQTSYAVNLPPNDSEFNYKLNICIIHQLDLRREKGNFT